ncbi:MAG: hypothetical protein J6R52_01140 [Alphaproteobacteria bacterium]|nr:hypothetical protein [Alphaproteobacteria bacterium]
MNNLLKQTIIDTANRNNVVLTRHPGIDEYIVKDVNGNILMEYTNGWDYGLYTLTIHGTTFKIEWYENANKAMTQEQRDMFDILHTISNRYAELERARNAAKHLTAKEQILIDFLNGKRIEKAK